MLSFLGCAAFLAAVRAEFFRLRPFVQLSHSSCCASSLFWMLFGGDAFLSRMCSPLAAAQQFGVCVLPLAALLVVARILLAAFCCVPSLGCGLVAMHSFLVCAAFLVLVRSLLAACFLVCPFPSSWCFFLLLLDAVWWRWCLFLSDVLPVMFFCDSFAASVS